MGAGPAMGSCLAGELARSTWNAWWQTEKAQRGEGRESRLRRRNLLERPGVRGIFPTGNTAVFHVEHPPRNRNPHGTPNERRHRDAKAL